jgi:hypothetical protein
MFRFATREEWLVAAMDAMRPWFTGIGAELPCSIRISVGFTRGTASENAATLGVTFNGPNCVTSGGNNVWRVAGGVAGQGPPRQCSIRCWSGVKPCATPHNTAWVRLPTSILR